MAPDPPPQAAVARARAHSDGRTVPRPSGPQDVPLKVTLPAVRFSSRTKCNTPLSVPPVFLAEIQCLGGDFIREVFFLLSSYTVFFSLDGGPFI